MAVSVSSTQVSTQDGRAGLVGGAGGGGSRDLENPHSMGIDAVKKLRQNYNINKVRRCFTSSARKKAYFFLSLFLHRSLQKGLRLYT